MTLLQWKPEYSLSIPAVDHEHREMIGLINQCYARMETDADPGALEQFLGEIHSGISAHFALEERLMRKAAYPDYAAHKEDHEELLDQIRDMMDHIDEDHGAGIQRLQAQLADWFGRHFATFDARLHDHFPD
jgi:hemerythrin